MIVSDSALTSRIQHYLRVVSAKGREVVKVGPFQATFTSHTDNPYLNYAIPEDGAEPSEADVRELIEAFRFRQRKPRFEYVPGVAPAVKPALEAAGFTVEVVTPLLVCEPGTEVLFDAPEGLEILSPQTDEELLGMVTVQKESYEGTLPKEGDVERLRSSLSNGTLAALVRTVDGHEPVGAGMGTPIWEGLTEVAGIATRPSWRRKGVALALTGWLTRHVIEAGATLPFLMALADEGARIYARAGYRKVGDVLHISLEAKS